ncbi:family 43 glycosylhydrolase [Olivibacter sp. XZL3]|uniref:family 43 glycosylhydrolase n=1 Tax=Olivibacter sp. XZL3 TaxID=1735116 RepID=UPI0010662438|nr:family 43 glycosylhydrolase [Olivibacter sp. XZL3]
MKKISLTIISLFITLGTSLAQKPVMYYTDSSSGNPVAKDPKIISFKNKYWMYYSVPGKDGAGWYIGVASSKDLSNWQKVGEIKPGANYEKNGLCAPGALVRGDTVHLFYQTYGNGARDAICHAYSTDGLNFTRNTTNPIFSPKGDWTCGRAIDAEVVAFKGKYLLYFATRDQAFQVQKQGVASASLGTNFNRDDWTQLTDSSILAPSLPWEKNCVEGASCLVKGDYLYMFYAGAYNNEPQQIGVARSKDGITWERMSDKPFLSNGKPGSWNAAESGHPDIFKDREGNYWLFYQGNNTGDGKSWYLSNLKLDWKGDQWPHTQ